ncbi:MAG: hypothetical protein A3G84_04885 [Chloroflexi bacterium RIFCSPLOWO2_12_FULL_71_12]|nr:MAG: hypothetical protein A3G84_04885 [Chloroflexi bacterium RIFCSPLOWO2_12_FULL_71_12]
MDLEQSKQSERSREEDHHKDGEVSTPTVSGIHEFTIVLEDVRGLTVEQVEQLYRRCKDATVGESDGVVRISFSRRGRTFADAVHRALSDLRNSGWRAARVELEELVSAAEVAERTGRSRESVRLLVAGRRGPGAFPAAVHTVGRFRLWRWPEVERWFASYEGRDPQVADHGPLVNAINLFLALRRQHGALPPAERREIEDWVMANDPAFIRGMRRADADLAAGRTTSLNQHSRWRARAGRRKSSTPRRRPATRTR